MSENQMALAAARNGTYALLLAMGCPLDKVKEAWKMIQVHSVSEDSIQLCKDAIYEINKKAWVDACGHKFVTDKDKANGECGLCGISFHEWHG